MPSVIHDTVRYKNNRAEVIDRVSTYLVQILCIFFVSGPVYGLVGENFVVVTKIVHEVVDDGLFAFVVVADKHLTFCYGDVLLRSCLKPLRGGPVDQMKAVFEELASHMTAQMGRNYSEFIGQSETFLKSMDGSLENGTA